VHEPATRAHEHVAVAPAGAGLSLGAAAGVRFAAAAMSDGLRGYGAVAGGSAHADTPLAAGVRGPTDVHREMGHGVAYAASSARSSRLARAICLLVVVRLTVSSAAISR